MSKTQVQNFYANKSVLITGATGFIGKVIVEKLLRSCPDLKCIYLLMRKKKGMTPGERIKTLTAARLFDNLRETNPKVFDKIHLVSGDILEEELELSNDDREELQNNCHVIFHSAACVRFDQKLKDAVELNTTGTLRLLQLAENMKNLEVLVHLSTAYCRCELLALEEKIYKAQHPPQKIMEMVNWMDDKLLTHLEPKLIDKEPNTYAYTKAITESLVDEYSHKFPIAIARPSIVIAALKEPMPGWVDSMNGPTGLIVGGGKDCKKRRWLKKTAVPSIFPPKPPKPSILPVEEWERGRPMRNRRNATEIQTQTLDTEKQRLFLSEQLLVPNHHETENALDPLSLNKDNLSVKSEALSKASEECIVEIESIKFLYGDVKRFKNKDNIIAAYSGFESYSKFEYVFSTVKSMAELLVFENYVSIEAENQFFLTMMKLKENKDDWELSEFFLIPTESVNEVFVKWIDLMDKVWSHKSVWSKDVVVSYIPECFKNDDAKRSSENEKSSDLIMESDVQTQDVANKNVSNDDVSKNVAKTAENIIKINPYTTQACVKSNKQKNNVQNTSKDLTQSNLNTDNSPTMVKGLKGGTIGVIRTMHCEPTYSMDAMPVDTVVNGCILAAYATAIDKPRETRVYNMTLSGAIKMTWGEIIELGQKWINEYPYELALWYPGGTISGYMWIHKVYKVFTHYVPAYCVDFLLFMLGKKTFLVKLQGRISHGLEVLQYYTTKEWYFLNDNFRGLRDRITEEDDKIFYTDVSKVDPDLYLKDYILGAREFCVKEDPATLPRSKKIHRIRYIADRSMKTILVLLFVWFIYSYSYIIMDVIGFFDSTLTAISPFKSVKAEEQDL